MILYKFETNVFIVLYKFYSIISDWGVVDAVAVVELKPKPKPPPVLPNVFPVVVDVPPNK